MVREVGAGTLARRLIVTVAASTLVLGACSTNSVSQTERVLVPTAIPAPAGIGTDGSELTLEVVDGGPTTGLVITNHQGFAVYGNAGETADSLVCVDDCVDVWVPVPPRAGTVPTSLDPALFAVMIRPDGRDQVTYNDIPLYTWTGDADIGITSGAGVAGTWYALTETAGFVGG